MDFASLLSSQISKAKTETSSDSNKYLSRREVEAQREAAYHAEQKKLEQERQAKLEKKRKFEEEEAARTHEREEKKRRLAEESKRRREEEEEQEERERRKRLGLPELPPKGDENEGTPIPAEEDVEEDTLLRKLRALGEPTKLFGETHAQRLRRYKRLTGRSSATPGPILSTGPIPTTLALLPEAEMKVPAQVPQDEEARRFLFRQLASYFTMVLTEYERAMAARPDDVKASSAGRQAHSWMVLARENLRPLFRKMEKFELEDDVLKPVVEIVKAAQERRYVHANDAYLRLSIGKAAWPIGVTMVGIHERSAREKLHESSKESAHIMSDESTRKYLQSIKRCLTFAQTRWPPDDHMQMMG